MPVQIVDAEVFGVTDTSATLSFVVIDDAGPCDAPARVRVGGEVRALSEGASGCRLIRIEGLTPGERHDLEIEAEGATAVHDEHFPAAVDTLPAPEAECVGSFATLNDLHFGEPRFGGTLLDDGDYGESAEGFPDVTDGEDPVPYWRFMNEDAIADINRLDVDFSVIKGDIADRGLPDQFREAAAAFARFEAPHHAFLGNHDYYALQHGEEVDGYGLLGQPPAPRCVDLGGWRLALLETALPGEHHGVFGDERLAWLRRVLDETNEIAMPTLLLMHHQPVPPEHIGAYPNDIGIRPDDSLALFDVLGKHPQVKGVLIGHTHRNRVRRYPAADSLPFVEVQCSKDYPGGYGHYRLFADGTFSQEVRRTSTSRALAHSTRCRGFFGGGYRRFALGPLSARSFLARSR